MLEHFQRFEINNPKQARFYQEIDTSLAAESKYINQIMRELKPELNPQTSAEETIDLVRQLAPRVPLIHPLDYLPEDRKTPDVYAMVNAFSKMESEVSSPDLKPEDLANLTSYAHLYNRYRMVVMDTCIAKNNPQSRFISYGLEEQQELIADQLHAISYRTPDRRPLRQACTSVHDVYVDLIKGQSEARLFKDGKTDDPMLYDPTHVRLTKDDIVAAGYQFHLISGLLLPQS